MQTKIFLFLVISSNFNWLGGHRFRAKFFVQFFVFACICRCFCSRMTYPGLWKASVALYQGIKYSVNGFIWCVIILISSNLNFSLKKHGFNKLLPLSLNSSRLVAESHWKKSHVLFQKVPVNLLSIKFIWFHFDLVISGFQKMDKEFWS